MRYGDIYFPYVHVYTGKREEILETEVKYWSNIKFPSFKLFFEWRQWYQKMPCGIRKTNGLEGRRLWL